jgi:hypothetical protein
MDGAERALTVRAHGAGNFWADFMPLNKSVDSLTNNENDSVVRATPRDVIKNPKEHKGVVRVEGAVAMFDLELGRVDITHDGARLICDISRVELSDSMKSELALSTPVSVCGAVKKRQRRTFLDASSLRLL